MADNNFSSVYSQKFDEELLDLYLKRGELSDDARKALEKEVKKRKISREEINQAYWTSKNLENPEHIKSTEKELEKKK